MKNKPCDVLGHYWWNEHQPGGPYCGYCGVKRDH